MTLICRQAEVLVDVRGVARSPCGREVVESPVGAGAVHGGGAAVHEDGHTDGLGDLLGRRAAAGGAFGVRHDAAVAFTGHGDGERDELLGAGAQRARRERGAVQLAEGAVGVGDRPAQVPSQRAGLLADRDGVHGRLLLAGELFTGVVPHAFSLSPSATLGRGRPA